VFGGDSGVRRGAGVLANGAAFTSRELALSKGRKRVKKTRAWSRGLKKKVRAGVLTFLELSFLY